MLSKERVFQIMGKYYGNAHYRSAIEQGIPEADLSLVVSVLNEINSLGYYFSNMNALKNTEDLRFVPIILKYFEQFISVNYVSSLINAICYPSYHPFVPQLLSIYEKTTSMQVRLDISQALFSIRSKKYIPEYLRIINKEDYGCNHDYLINLLCKLRVQEVLATLLKLVDEYPYEWTWTFLKYAPNFKNASLLPRIEPYLTSKNSEFRLMAKKAIKKLDANNSLM